MITVALFAKPPIAGKTKSRLARTIGEEAAAAFARAALVDNLAVLQAAEVMPSLWHPPGVGDEGFGDLIPAEFAIRQQQGADLGERMAFAIDAALQEGARGALVIGADCVTHTPASLARAARLLEDSEVVLQPAADGGFVLIGTRRPAGALLDGLIWGGAEALSQVVARLRDAGMACAMMEATHDVDVAADLAPARKWVEAHNPAGAVARWFAEYAP